MPISIEQAKRLSQGQTLYHCLNRNADGTPQRWKVTSVKTWSTRPSEVEVRLKYGIRTYDRISQRELNLVALTEEDATKED